MIQDRYNQLSAVHLAALAQEMRLPLAEVYEVATFYAHFDVVREDQSPPPPLTVRVCDSLTCEMMGARRLLAELPEKLGKDVRVVRAPCMGRCETAPVAEVGHRHINDASVETVAEAAKGGHLDPDIPPYVDFDSYTADGGYKLLRDCLDGKRTPEDLIRVMDESGLRGLGGAGFPMGQKWRIVRGFPGPRLMAVNADEGEPGTFKDRYYMEMDPHRMLEGMLVAAWVTEAEEVYFYLRDEYPGLLKILGEEVAHPRGLGPRQGDENSYPAGRRRLHLRRRIGNDREHRREAGTAPPPPSLCRRNGPVRSAYLVQNVETVYWIRDLVEKGTEWFYARGKTWTKGLA